MWSLAKELLGKGWAQYTLFLTVHTNEDGGSVFPRLPSSANRVSVIVWPGVVQARKKKKEGPPDVDRPAQPKRASKSGMKKVAPFATALLPRAPQLRRAAAKAGAPGGGRAGVEDKLLRRPRA